MRGGEVNRLGNSFVDSRFVALNSFPKGFTRGFGRRRSAVRRSTRSACARAAQLFRFTVGEVVGMGFSDPADLGLTGRARLCLNGETPSWGNESRAKFCCGGTSSEGLSRLGFGATSRRPEVWGLGFKSLTSRVREGLAAI